MYGQNVFVTDGCPQVQAKKIVNASQWNQISDFFSKRRKKCLPRCDTDALSSYRIAADVYT